VWVIFAINQWKFYASAEFFPLKCAFSGLWLAAVRHPLGIGLPGSVFLGVYRFFPEFRRILSVCSGVDRFVSVVSGKYPVFSAAFRFFR
jgi:hypothetical protein